MREFPSVTAIIPCFNEKNHISGCLDSVIANDYPKDRLELLVIDGMSRDGTREILERYAVRFSFVGILDNHKKITPAALNVGVRHAKGDIIVRMDAHSTYEKSYISKCIKYLNEYNADNVGGIWVTVPRKDSLMARAITFSLSHLFGVGNAHYKVGGISEPKWVDTVPFGCFRKDIFKKIGFFNETLHRNEDIEFNARLRRFGGKILLVPDIKIKYYARSSFMQFMKHNFDNGIKVTYPFNFHKMIFSWRHLIPLIFVVSLLLSLGMWWLLYLAGGLDLIGKPMFMAIMALYLLFSFYFSSEIAVKEKDPKMFFLMPAIFATLHLSYGIGSVCGLFKNVFWKNSTHKES